MQIPLAVPSLRGNEMKYLEECIQTNFVSSVGPFVEKFEKAVASFLGESSHTVAVMSGTAGLHLALHALGVKDNDFVLVPNLTFIAPINAVLYCGGEPIFVDSSETDFGMDYDKLQESLFTNTIQLQYKNLCGEFHTASAFGFWVATKVLKTQTIPDVLRLNSVKKSSYKTVLLYNQNKGAYHSFTLLTV